MSCMKSNGVSSHAEWIWDNLAAEKSHLLIKDNICDTFRFYVNVVSLLKVNYLLLCITQSRIIFHEHFPLIKKKVVVKIVHEILMTGMLEICVTKILEICMLTYCDTLNVKLSTLGCCHVRTYMSLSHGKCSRNWIPFVTIWFHCKCGNDLDETRDIKQCNENEAKLNLNTCCLHFNI